MTHSFGQTATYGFAADATWRGEFGGYEDGFQKVRITRSEKDWGEFRVPMAGRHNLQNAIAALAVAGTLGVPAGDLAEILPRFRGVRRRMEVFLESQGDLFVSDFAHHPTAIRVTIQAAKERWPDRRLVALFEPRSNTTVTNRFQPEITQALAGADEVILGPIHRAEKTPEKDRLDREEVCADLARDGKTGDVLGRRGRNRRIRDPEPSRRKRFPDTEQRSLWRVVRQVEGGVGGGIGDPTAHRPGPLPRTFSSKTLSGRGLSPDLGPNEVAPERTPPSLQIQRALSRLHSSGRPDGPDP